MSPDEIAERVNFYGLGEFNRALFHWLSSAWPPPISIKRAPAANEADVRNVMVAFSRQENVEQAREGDDIVITRVDFGRFANPPYGLSMWSETRQSAEIKLSRDTALSSDNTRISYFLDDALVVELTFKPEEPGLLNVAVVRLGAPRDWRTRKIAN